MLALAGARWAGTGRALDRRAVESVAPSGPDAVKKIEAGLIVLKRVQEERAIDNARHFLVHTRDTTGDQLLPATYGG